MIEGDDQRRDGPRGSTPGSERMSLEGDAPRGGRLLRGRRRQPADRPGADLPRRAGAGRTIQPGQRVRVPLGRGNRLATGYCVRVDGGAAGGPRSRELKDVVEVLDPVPLIDARMLELTRWMADYYVCSWGQALDSAVPAGVRNQAGTRVGTFLVVPEETRQRLNDTDQQAELSPKQAAALEVLCRAEEPLTLADVCRLARCASAPVMALRRQGLIHSVRRRLAFEPRADAIRRRRAADPARRSRRRVRSERSMTEPQTPRLVLTDEQAVGHGRDLARPASGGLRPVPDPRRHRQRQDRGLPHRRSSRSSPGAARRSCWSPRSA